jgi:hypothetical protein
MAEGDFGGGAVNPPSPTGGGGGGGGGDVNYSDLFGNLLGGFGQLFGSQGSSTVSRNIRPPSADELNLQGYTLDKLFNAGPNPVYGYGVGGQANLLESGMRASPAQLGYLDEIRRNTIDTGTRGVNDWLADAQRGNKNAMLARGMDASSVDLWGQDQATKAAMNRLADLIGGANTQYAQSATALPYQTAGVYGNMATAGQNEGNQAMTQLQEFLKTLQAPRLAEVSQTTTSTPGGADKMGSAGELISLLGPLMALFA